MFIKMHKWQHDRQGKGVPANTGRKWEEGKGWWWWGGECKLCISLLAWPNSKLLTSNNAENGIIYNMFIVYYLCLVFGDTYIEFRYLGKWIYVVQVYPEWMRTQRWLFKGIESFCHKFKFFYHHIFASWWFKTSIFYT